MQKPRQTIPLLKQMMRVAEFLQSQNVIHFDAHMANILSDGKTAYLTDFRLSLDSDFDLSDREQAFLKQHRQYDTAQLLHSLVWPVLTPFSDETLEQEAVSRFGLQKASNFEFQIFVLTHIQELVESGLLALDSWTREWAIRYGQVMATMARFYNAMRAGSRKNHPFPNQRLARLLKAAQT